jgi:hypothetical protein
MQSLILHLPHLERQRVIEAVKRLYLERLRIGNTIIPQPVAPQAGELLLTQAVAEAVDYTFQAQPARATEFVTKLDRYERRLRRLRLSDDLLALFPEPRGLLRASLGWAALAVLTAPVALYGWAHRLIPSLVVSGIVKQTVRKPPDKTQISTASIVSGGVVFTLFYALCVLVFHRFFGWPAALWYALSLPVAGLAAVYYSRHLRRLSASLRAVIVSLRAPAATRKLVAARAELIELIEAGRRDLKISRARNPTGA